MAESVKTAASSTQQPLTKTEAVKKSFAKLGKKAMPKDVRDDVKKTFGMDASLNLISTVKSDLGKAKKPVAAAKKPAAKGVTTLLAKAAPSVGGNGSMISLDDVLMLKAIVGRVGAANVKTLVDAMSH